ncbi:mechanosensitive ion channel protein MscS [Shewanella mangrovi]|uniref:Mechanosensitive ion channel protein MscS n=1 Tax=Shewanella mangrovi TaxID=1515746 RepID=A0A094JD42_9GAMM|nr:mechanosensitive ion channel domain-containing protein [Shewanella mangrovi]KFZ35959.1 mechanosensitive ion channel protein MscS [Shewanella mangrovi]
MDQDLRVVVSGWLSQLGIESKPSGWLSSLLLVIVCVALASLVYFLLRRVVVGTMNLMVLRSKVTWDDIFVRHRVFEKLSMIVPVMMLNLLIPIALSANDIAEKISDRLLTIWLIIAVVRAVYACLDAINEISDVKLVSRRLPIKSFVQLFKLFLFFVCAIVSVSIMADQSPVYFLSGLGVATGLVMLVFKDTILGFVAGIQLAANRMVSPGDWIQMDKYGADGAVEEVSLITVKVRNWDHTISMIPAYALVSDAFKNWRGMSESGGRRIKRAINIDINTIRFLTLEEQQRLSKINYLKDYLPKKTQELVESNATVSDMENMVNGRRMTNVGTFRAYLVEYLKHHEKVHQQMTLMVRQLSPTTEGLPLELYIFTNDTRWIVYEEIQSDIFDHIFAILPEFGLRAFQSPTGIDIRSIKQSDTPLS